MNFTNYTLAEIAQHAPHDERFANALLARIVELADIIDHAETHHYTDADIEQAETDGANAERSKACDAFNVLLSIANGIEPDDPATERLIAALANFAENYGA